MNHWYDIILFGLAVVFALLAAVREYSRREHPTYVLGLMSLAIACFAAPFFIAAIRTR